MRSGMSHLGGLCNGSTPDSDSVCEGSNPSPPATKKTTFVYQTNVVFFELSVPCGTISTPSVREAMLFIVKCLRAWVAHLTSLRA